MSTDDRLTEFNLASELSAARAALRDLESAVDTAQDEIRVLETALQTARTVGMAVGIVMARRVLTEEQAYDVLVRAGQDRRVPLNVLADEVIRTGEPPQEDQTREPTVS